MRVSLHGVVRSFGARTVLDHVDLTFGPLMAEASHWFERYRGLAVAIAASGNYIGGAIWPTLVNHGIETMGWRTTHIALGIFTAVAMTLALIGLRMLMGAGGQRDHVRAQ